MPFRARFDCLWCGRAHATRSTGDLEGWAQLCPDCLGRAGDNGFLRSRLRTALAERAAVATRAEDTLADAERADAERAEDTLADAARSDAARSDAARSDAARSDAARDLVAYYEALAPVYDDRYARRGRYARGPVHDVAWQVDLDAATLWLDRLPFVGEIVELAAGTGWWSALLAGKGTLRVTDAADAPLDLARRRLRAHGLAAHIHRRDAWAEPDRRVDGLFAGFWLSHVPNARLDEFLALARRWLRPGGLFAFIDARADPLAGAVGDEFEAEAGVERRRLAHGREFNVPMVYREPPELEAALVRAGFGGVEVGTTSRFFVIGRASA